MQAGIMVANLAMLACACTSTCGCSSCSCPLPGACTFWVASAHNTHPPSHPPCLQFYPDLVDKVGSRCRPPAGSACTCAAWPCSASRSRPPTPLSHNVFHCPTL